jgi:rRNA maturation endonuclease Nob1
MILVTLAGLLLALAVGAFTLYPIFRDSGATEPASANGLADLRARRDRVYAELRDLEFDYRVGKLTTADYEEARGRLELEAARVLQALDVQVRAIDEEIEREVRAIRESRQRRSFCPACGEAVDPKARFCAACGAALTVASQR